MYIHKLLNLKKLSTNREIEVILGALATYWPVSKHILGRQLMITLKTENVMDYCTLVRQQWVIKGSGYQSVASLRVYQRSYLRLVGETLVTVTALLRMWPYHTCTNTIGHFYSTSMRQKDNFNLTMTQSEKLNSTAKTTENALLSLAKELRCSNSFHNIHVHKDQETSKWDFPGNWNGIWEKNVQ